MTQLPRPRQVRPVPGQDRHAATRLLKTLGTCLSNIERGREPMNAELYMATTTLARRLMPLVGQSEQGAALIVHCPALWELLDGGPLAAGFGYAELMVLLRGPPAAPAVPAPGDGQAG